MCAYGNPLQKPQKRIIAYGVFPVWDESRTRNTLEIIGLRHLDKDPGVGLQANRDPQVSKIRKTELNIAGGKLANLANSHWQRRLGQRDPDHAAVPFADVQVAPTESA
jgi:hypothetical protein